MKKVKTFLHIFINSLFPYKAYYHKLLLTRLSFTIKYFFTLVIVVHIFFAVIFFAKNVIFNPDIAIIKNNIMKMMNQYPKDLIITIKNNIITTNYDRPYLAWFDYKNIPYLLAAVDPYAEPDKIYQYDAFILLGMNGFTIRNPKTNMITTYPFLATTEYIVNKQKVNQWQETFIDHVAFRFPLIIFIGYLIVNLFFVISFIIGKFIYLAVFSLLIFGIIFYFIKHKKISYAKILQISLHASTLPLIFEYIVIVTRLRFSFFDGGLILGPVITLFWLFSIVYAAFLIAAVYEALNKEHIIHHHAHHKHQ